MKTRTERDWARWQAEAGALHGRPRGGGDAAPPGRLEPRPGVRRAARRPRAGPRCAPQPRDPRGGDRVRVGALPPCRRGDDGAGRAAGVAQRRARRARSRRGRRRYPPVRHLGGDRDLARAPLPLRARVDGRAGPPRAHLRHARARRLRRPRARPRDRQPDARPPAAPVGAVGQLALLAGPRQLPGVGTDAGLRHLPAHRDPAPVRGLHRLRGDARDADRLRCVPGAQLRLVGPAAATVVRDARDPGDGHPDGALANGGAGGAGAFAGPARGARPAGPRGADRGAGAARGEPLSRRPRRRTRGAPRPDRAARDPRRGARRAGGGGRSPSRERARLRARARPDRRRGRRTRRSVPARDRRRRARPRGLVASLAERFS